jgi:thiamine pyrophosphokinase
MKKKAIVFLSGELDVEQNYYKNIDYLEYDVFCADGGANYAYKLGIIPKLILGDLDSVSENVILYFKGLGVPIEKFPKSKDFTDGELILEKVVKKYDKILVLGGLGGRTDHFLTHINMLEKYQNIELEDENEILFFIKNNKKIKGKIGKTISLIPLSDIEGLTLEGFKYEIRNINLSRTSSLCMSNIIISDDTLIKYGKGSIIGIIQK